MSAPLRRRATLPRIERPASLVGDDRPEVDGADTKLAGAEIVTHPGPSLHPEGAEGQYPGRHTGANRRPRHDAGRYLRQGRSHPWCPALEGPGSSNGVQAASRGLLQDPSPRGTERATTWSTELEAGHARDEVHRLLRQGRRRPLSGRRPPAGMCVARTASA